MERPKIKDYFAEKSDVTTVHNEYINSPHLYSYASSLDRYIDYLEDKLIKLIDENNLCTEFEQGSEKQYSSYCKKCGAHEIDH